MTQLRETVRIITPGELPRVDDDTADCVAVAAYPFRSGVDDDVCAMFNWTNKVSSCAERIVHDEGDTLCMSDFSDPFNVRDIILRISDGFDVDCLGLFIDGCSEGFWIVSVDEFSLDAEIREEDFELIVCSAVEVGGGDDIVSCACECGDSHELS